MRPLAGPVGASIFLVWGVSVRPSARLLISYLISPPRRVQWGGSLVEHPQPASSLTRNRRNSHGAPPLPPFRPAQVRCCVVSSVTRGGRARARRGTSRKSGRLPRTTRGCTYAHGSQFQLTALRLPPGAIPRSSRDGPAQTRRACSEVASSVARGGPPAAACSARTYVRMRGSGVVVDLPPSRRAMRHARTLGQRKARALQTGTARPAIAHSASLAHVPLLSRAMCADDGPWRTRALQQPPLRPVISADPVGRRAPPVWSDRPKIPVTFVAKHLRSASVRAWTRPRTHKRKATKGSNYSRGTGSEKATEG